MEYRVETDSLGDVRVPKNALYGAQTQRAINNYPISGRPLQPALITAYLRIKQAAARANAECKALRPEQGKAIEKAVEQLFSKTYRNRWQEIFPVDPFQAGAGTSTNMNFNEVIATLANQNLGSNAKADLKIHPNDHVNRSQSTNDTYPTAMRLALLDVSRELVESAEKLAQSFQNKADQWKDIPKSGRTHLQDAVPMSLGQEFSGYAATLKRCQGWLSESRDHLRELGIGGSAVGTGITTPARYRSLMITELSKLTGEKLRSASNLFEVMQSQAAISYYFGAVKILALELTRISNDLRLMASGPATGLNEIFLPAVQPGSSIMPGKVNPSILEMLNQTCFYVLGLEQTATFSTQAGQLELNVMMPILCHSTIEGTSLISRAITVLRTKCLDGIKPNRAKLKKYFESSSQIATALSPRLGYQQTAELVKEAVTKDISVVDLVRQKKLIPETELRKLLDLDTLIGKNR
jgi:aspartate ammonia-lyase